MHTQHAQLSCVTTEEESLAIELSEHNCMPVMQYREWGLSLILLSPESIFLEDAVETPGYTGVNHDENNTTRYLGDLRLYPRF